MSQTHSSSSAPPRPPSTDSLGALAHQRLDCLIAFCLANESDDDRCFLAFERDLLGLLLGIGQVLVQLFLLRRQQRLELPGWLRRGYRLSDPQAPRTLKTAFGPVEYRRAYLVPKDGAGPGVHPLDAELGLSRDRFSPLVIGWFTRLATRLSFRLASELGGMFLSWAPPHTAIEGWTLGLARPAYVYLSTGPLPQGDGEVLVIECDGKAAPTATDEELAKRRGQRQGHKKNCHCGCQRHRGGASRKRRGAKKKRKRGDKSKNGRSATLVAMYTLRRDQDGRLHGPINKKVYGSFSSRRVVLSWTRQQATRRGFGADTDKTVQIVVDGEECLANRLRTLFPKAIITLDVRHAQEKLWKLGRLLHPEGSEELAAWVEPLSKMLYDGQIGKLLRRLRRERALVARRGPGTKRKRKKMAEVIEYLSKRQGMMAYGRWRQQDLVIASGWWKRRRGTWWGSDWTKAACAG